MEIYRLSEILGKFHDISVLKHHIVEKNYFETDEIFKYEILNMLKNEEIKLEKKLLPIAFWIFAEKPYDFVNRLEKYWYLNECKFSKYY
ncbi:MAG: hypothetical protein IPM32_15485 [Ignavibacteriae bacterium]|nr:hypothetical protein [Ignavibacteriota bacterium]